MSPCLGTFPLPLPFIDNIFFFLDAVSETVVSPFGPCPGFHWHWHWHIVQNTTLDDWVGFEVIVIITFFFSL
jgi:hypothetical protein